MSCLSAQSEKIWGNILSLHTFVLRYRIRKEGRIPSSDLVLVSRDSTMGKMYPPIDVYRLEIEPRVVDEGHGRRAQN